MADELVMFTIIYKSRETDTILRNYKPSGTDLHCASFGDSV